MRKQETSSHSDVLNTAAIARKSYSLFYSCRVLLVGVQPMDDCDHGSRCAFVYQRPEARSTTPVSPHPISFQNHSRFGINVVVGDLHRAYLCCIEVLTCEPVCLLLYMGSNLGFAS
jgi:hypothetical protein